MCVYLITSRGNSCSEYGPNVCVCVYLRPGLVIPSSRDTGPWWGEGDHVSAEDSEVLFVW